MDWLRGLAPGIGSGDWLLLTPRYYTFAVRCSQNIFLVHPSVYLLAAHYMQTQNSRHWSGFAQSRIRLHWRSPRPLPPLRHPAPACAGRASAAPAGFSRLCKRSRVPSGPGGRTRHATCPNPKESFTLKGLERFHLPPDAGRFWDLRAPTATSPSPTTPTSSAHAHVNVERHSLSSVQPGKNLGRVVLATGSVTPASRQPTAMQLSTSRQSERHARRPHRSYPRPCAPLRSRYRRNARTLASVQSVALPAAPGHRTPRSSPAFLAVISPFPGLGSPRRGPRPFHIRTPSPFTPPGTTLREMPRSTRGCSREKAARMSAGANTGDRGSWRWRAA
jgi:hypothetical protein